MRRIKQDETTLKNLWTYAWTPEPMTSTLATTQVAMAERQQKITASLLPVPDPENYLDAKDICELFGFSHSYLSGLKSKEIIALGTHYIMPGGPYFRNSHFYNVPAMREVLSGQRPWKGDKPQVESPPAINHQALKASLEAPDATPPVVEVELVNGRFEGKAPILRDSDHQKLKDVCAQLRDLEFYLANQADNLPPLTADLVNLSRYNIRCGLNSLFTACNPGKRFFRDERMYSSSPERQINSAS